MERTRSGCRESEETLQRVVPPPITPTPTPATRPTVGSALPAWTRRERPVIVAFVMADVVFALVLLITGGRPGMQTFATVFLGIFIEAMPFVLLGALVSGVIGVFVRDETVARLLPSGRL